MRRVWNRLSDLMGFRGKTLWDWMALLIVPLVIVAATAVLSYFESERENKRAEALRVAEVNRVDAQRKADIERADALLEVENRRAQAQQRIEDDSVKQTLLESYIRDISDLLLHEGLFKPKPSVPIGEQPPDSSDVSPVKQIARARTLTTVRQLDGARKALLLQFLYESNLIGAFTKEGLGGTSINVIGADPIINLSGADLRDANLFRADLEDADLSGGNLFRANLFHANLSRASLFGADLSFANLTDADLGGANLTDADLGGANLEDANLTGANLEDADVSDANLTDAVLADAFLTDANLSSAHLSGANLANAFLPGIDLSHADLSRVDLTGANLSGVNLSSAREWTKEQLAQAESLVGATLADGTKMTEEGWEEFKKQYRQ
jgi:uncharacterized protein YjbI with pentapeptide repeats